MQSCTSPATWPPSRVHVLVLGLTVSGACVPAAVVLCRCCRTGTTLVPLAGSRRCVGLAARGEGAEEGSSCVFGWSTQLPAMQAASVSLGSSHWVWRLGVPNGRLLRPALEGRGKRQLFLAGRQESCSLQHCTPCPSWAQ
jgi:hypothetical protein